MADDTPQVEEEQQAPAGNSAGPDALNGSVEGQQETQDSQGGDSNEAVPANAPTDETAFSWQSSEYVHHHKGAVWFLGLFAGGALLVAATVLLHYWLEAGAIVLMCAAIVVYATKPPRTLLYELTPKGVTIEGKFYPFAEFRSFGVVPDEEWHSIDLEPAARFRPRISMLFNTEDLEVITGYLELHLPREDRAPDMIEQVTRYLRF